MVGGVQTPENTDLMRQEMIDKMGEFPHDIPVNKPIPGESGFEDSIPGKQPNAQGDHGKRDEPAYECIEYVSEERYLIMNDVEPFVECPSDDFDE